MTVPLTPLAERTSDFVVSLAMHAAIARLIEQDEEVQAARTGGLDLNDPEERDLMIEVMHDAKVINEAFLVAGTILEQEHGISA